MSSREASGQLGATAIVLKFEIWQNGGHNSNPRSNVTSLNDLGVGGLPEVRGFMPKCEKKS